MRIPSQSFSPRMGKLGWDLQARLRGEGKKAESGFGGESNVLETTEREPMGIKIGRIDSFAEMEKIREEWDECLSLSSQDCVFLTFDWFCSWWKSFGNGSELRILIARDASGSVRGIAPLMLIERELRFMASREVTDYCDLIIRQGDEDEIVNAFLLDIMKNKNGAEKLHLINIRESSGSLPPLFRSAKENNLSCDVRDTEVALRLDLPQSYQSYLSSLSRKNRHELRRKMKKLLNFPGSEIKRVSAPAEIQALLGAFIALHGQSSPSKAGFWEKNGTAGFFREIVSRFSRRDWVELHLLSIGGQQAAMLLSFLYNNEILNYNIACDLRFSAFSPGICLFCHSIERSIAQGRQRMDFLRGGERYKYDFGANECKIKDIILLLKDF